jgi:hypothetical protein
MLKTVVIGTTALFLTASSIANAQSSQTSSPATPERLNATDQNTLTDMRVDLVKAALQLTPEQEKLWPPVESAIRSNAEDRRGRIAKIQETVGIRATKAVWTSCAIVTPSPFCNGARKHWLNDQPIWISSPRRGSHSTIRLAKNRGSAWRPSRSLCSAT